MTFFLQDFVDALSSVEVCVGENLVEDESFFPLLANNRSLGTRITRQKIEASLRYLTYYMGIPYAPMI